MNFLTRSSRLTKRFTCLVILLTGCVKLTVAQVVNDSLQKQKSADTTVQTIKPNLQTAKDLRKYKAVIDSNFSPRQATIRSAIFPGLGQIYNHQYWKLPLVYGAVGATAGIFFYNVKTYRELRHAYIIKTDKDSLNDNDLPRKYKVPSANSIKYNRDIFRRNVDYSVLAFLIAWGLNVVDATVSAHLKQFDVSDDLSLKVKPMLSADGRMGVGLVMNFK